MRTGAMGVPASVHVPGDCYVWGSSDPNSAGSKSAASTVPGWLNSSVPTLVDNTTHLDVCEVRASNTCTCPHNCPSISSFAFFCAMCLQLLFALMACCCSVSVLSKIHSSMHTSKQLMSCQRLEARASDCDQPCSIS